MKIKPGFVLRQVAGNHIVIPSGKAAVDFSGMITLNNSGVFLWNLLEEETTEEKLLGEMLNEYEIDEDTAKNDIRAFIEKLESAGLLD